MQEYQNTPPGQDLRRRKERQATFPEATSQPHGLNQQVLQLQRTFGNRKVRQFLQAKRLTSQGMLLGLQRKLTVGAADDQYEQEADQVARQVMNTSDAAVARSLQRTMTPEEDEKQKIQTKPVADSITRFVQRQGQGEEKEESIQTKASGSLADSFEAGAEVETQLSLSKGRGSPLPDTVRGFMEPRFGTDFSHVRVHTGSDAIQMNRAVGAQAFTHGSDIYFGAGHGPTELALTAHELTHVVQQTGGRALHPRRSPELATGEATPVVRRACGACAAKKTPHAMEEAFLRRQITPIPSDRDRAAEQGVLQRRADQAPLVHTRGVQLARVPVRVQRYSWDEFVGDVEDVGDAVADGVHEVEEVVGDGVDAVGEVVGDGAKAVGEVIDSGVDVLGDGAKAVGDTVSDVVDWVMTEAGQVALAEASQLASALTGSVTIGPTGLVISIPSIELFAARRQEIIPPTPRSYVPLLGAGAMLGPVALVGSVGIPVGAPTMTMFLGPGRLQNIEIRIDPVASTYGASGEVYIGEAINAYAQTGGAVRVDAVTAVPTEPPIPLEAAVEGGVLLTLQGSQVGAFVQAVGLSYTGGSIGLNLTETLRLGVITEADLDAYLNAQVYGIELCEYIWPLKHWEASRAEEYSLPLSLQVSGGAVNVTMGPASASPMPVSDIETGLERYRPETQCKAWEELREELCKLELLPVEDATEPEQSMGAQGQSGASAGFSCPRKQVGGVGGSTGCAPVVPHGAPRVSKPAGENTCTPDYNAVVNWDVVSVDADNWGVCVGSLELSGQINIKPWPSVPDTMTVPNTANPVDGGNIENRAGSRNHWHYAIRDMADYDTAGVGGAGVYWHSTAASEAHEWEHWNDDYMADAVVSAAGGNWGKVNNTLNMLREPKSTSPDPVDARIALEPKVQLRVRALRENIIRRWNHLVSTTDSPGKGGRGYAAGMRVLNGIISDVRNYKDRKGW